MAKGLVFQTSNQEIRIHFSLLWATSWQNQQNDLFTKTQISLGIHPGLIRVFAVGSVDSWGPNVSSCGQRRLWSDWADVQADLSPRWAQRSFCWFCHKMAHMRLCLKLNALLDSCIILVGLKYWWKGMLNTSLKMNRTKKGHCINPMNGSCLQFRKIIVSILDSTN